MLEGAHVRLEPLRKSHAKPLLKSARDSDLSLLRVDLRDEREMRRWIAEALDAGKAGSECPFVVRSTTLGRVVGSTRYMDVRAAQRGVEIGWTWYEKRVWGTAVNPECKYLLLRHAFRDWGAVRVQLKTDDRNVHSQRAILKLGAKYEGRLRNHRIRRDGSVGDSMMYSITSEEWNAGLRRRLLARIRASTPP